MASLSQPKPLGSQTRLTDQMQQPWIALLFVAAITFVVYYGTLSFEFVWDDVPQIVDNPLLRSWQSISRIFFSDLWFHTSRSQIYYRPLFVLWSILNFKIFGLHPWGWHLTTLLLHVAATCAFFHGIAPCASSSGLERTRTNVEESKWTDSPSTNHTGKTAERGPLARLAISDKRT